MKFPVRYVVRRGRRGAPILVIGGLAFIYHARPRYTKDMDLRIDRSARGRRRSGG